jgi:hypothetical protein
VATCEIAKRSWLGEGTRPAHHLLDPASDRPAYMTLATADADGLPWASPVWFAPAGYREFFWVSDPEARHSRNLAVRPQLGIVIFDSRAAISTGQGVYMSAVAEQLTGAGLDAGIRVSRCGPRRTKRGRGHARTWRRRRAIASIARPRPSTSC